jgi:hypothetical protein
LGGRNADVFSPNLYVSHHHCGKYSNE